MSPTGPGAAVGRSEQPARGVVGVDGGGTRTRLVLLDDAGRVLERSTAPATGIDELRSAAESAHRVATAVRELLARSSHRTGAAPRVGALWCGLAGAGTTPVQLAFEHALALEDLADRVGVGTDVEAAFEHAFGSEPGWLLVAGTGSVAWARERTGDAIRVGGWGREFGDEGSAFDLGRQAILAVLRGADGRDDEPGFAPALQDATGCADGAALATWARARPKHDIAALAPLVTHAADRGDARALELVDEALQALEAHVSALDRRAPRAPLALAGALVDPGGPLRSLLEARLRKQGIVVRPGFVDAALGAAHLARRRLLESA